MIPKFFQLAFVLFASGIVPRAQTPSGSLDPSFDAGSNVSNSVWAIAIQPDGKIVAAVAAQAPNLLLRLNPDGSLDSTFDARTAVNDVVGVVEGLALLPDGKFIIANETETNGFQIHIQRLNADGSPDSTFQSVSLSSQGVGFAIQADKKILLAGDFTTVHGVSRSRIARLNADGSLDTAFNPVISVGVWGNSGAFGVTALPDGKIIVGGGFVSVNGVSRKCIARLNGDGTLDRTFDAGTNAENGVSGIVMDNAGKFMVAGNFRTADDPGRLLVRLNGDGSLDPTFNAEFSNYRIIGTVIQSNGKIIAWTSNYADASGTERIIRLNTDGSVDDSFYRAEILGEFNTNGDVSQLAFQSDGRMVIAGHFTTVDGESRNYIARLWGDSPPLIPISLNIALHDGALVLNWVDPRFVLQASSIVMGAYGTIIGATSPYTNSTALPAQYFRLHAE